MPKKTKQGKILAQLHRLQSNQNTASETSSSSTKTQVSLNLESITKESQIVEGVPTKSAIYDYSYVMLDLKKTLFFAVIAIIFEFFLSFVLKSWI